MVLPDYFTFYELPQSFFPDKEQVRKQYYALSRKFHPDRANAQEGAMEAALTMSALNNEAYKTLSDVDKTMAYVLRINGVLDSEESYKLPPAFLMEIMDLNEAIGNAAETPEMLHEAVQEYHRVMAEWQANTLPLMQQFDAGERSADLFASLKEFYFRKKYLLRLGKRLAL